MSVVYLLLGTNLGNKAENLSRAKKYIQQQNIKILKESGVYETSSWGFNHPETFYNQVIKIETDLLPEILLKEILNIEQLMGRIRNAIQYEARIIDLDILFYDDKIIQSENLTIPHPLLHVRRFTLEPLCEIAPLLIHPVFNKTIQDLLNECEDTGIVNRF
jgi:2-amino-4-hydroxy-6-hydroxymethyldihydropteridine diphosphokinase